nr:unnamed protein product [Callosobruchus analis]
MFNSNFFQVYINRETLQVCQKFIMAVYNVGQRRLNTICKKLQSGDEVIKENRGRDTRTSKFVEKLNAVKPFISQLQGNESHYGRKKSRIDLPGLSLGHTLKKKKIDSLKTLLETLSEKNWYNDPELEWLFPILTEYCEDEETVAEENQECECTDMEEINFI